VKVLVTASRTWTMHGPVRRRLSKYPPGTIVIHGNARGGDTVADIVARELGFQVRTYPVTDQEWAQLGPKAGHIRNARMLSEEHPDADGLYIDAVEAFTSDPSKLAESRGTNGMVKMARSADPSIEVTVTGSPWLT